MVTKVYIYGLADPDDWTIRYVGKSVNPEQRLYQHIKSDVNNAQKMEWLEGLAAQGKKPLLIMLEETGIEHWRDREQHWIDYYQSDSLTNIAKSGQPKPVTKTRSISKIVFMITDEDRDAIRTIKEHQGMMYDSDAVRYALRKVAEIIKRRDRIKVNKS